MNVVNTSGYLKARPPTPAYQPPEPVQKPVQPTQSAVSLHPRPATDQTTAKITAIDTSPEVRSLLLRYQEAETPAISNMNDDAPLAHVSESPVADVENKNASGAGGNKNIFPADGLSAEGMTVKVSGTTAVVSFADGSDQLILNLEYGSITLTFADGTIAQVMTQTPMRALEAAKATDSRGVVKMV